MPEISVIIPNYNRAALLGRAVESVRAQDFEDIEILIVDDGSEDNTLEIVADLQRDEPRIRLVRHTQNRGEAAARNTGLREASGRLIAFLDSDDSWLKGKLHRQYAALEEADNDVAAVVTGNIIVAQDGKQHYDDAWHFHHDITVRNLLVRGCALSSGSNSLIRREAALAAGPFDETLRLYVDVDWLCRFLDRYRMIAINEPYTIYYKAALRDGALVELAIKAFLEKNVALMKRFSWSDRRLILSKFYENLAVSHKANGDRVGFLRATMKSLLANPKRRPGVYVDLLESALGIHLQKPLARVLGRKTASGGEGKNEDVAKG